MKGKVVVATTFRDFKGNDNDSIQWMFLWGLRRSSAYEVLPAISMFGEVQVEAAVKSVFPAAICFQQAPPTPFRYSQSSVLLNGIKAMEQSDARWLLWTTCDVLIPPTFLQDLSKGTSGRAIRTTHPHDRLYPDGKLHHYPLASGFDSLALSRELALDPRLKDMCAKYVFYDWGIYEHFIIAAAAALGARFDNCLSSSIVKFENDRQLTSESAQWLSSAWESNADTLERFLRDQRLPRSFLSLYYCHKLFGGSRGLLSLKDIVLGEAESFARRLQPFRQRKSDRETA